LAKTARLDAQVPPQFGHSMHSNGRLQLTRMPHAAKAKLKALVHEEVAHAAGQGRHLPQVPGLVRSSRAA
jgi:hypothetical protein